MLARPPPFIGMLAVALSCGGASPPPSVAPRETPRATTPPPPWTTRLSIADGYEAKRDPATPVVIRNATLLLATGRTIQHGTVVLDKGKIVAVAEGELPAPVGATVIDGTGKFVTPGLIDVHSHLG